MSDFEVRFEYDEYDPNIVTKMHCTFEPSMIANRIHAFLEDMQRQVKRESHVAAVIEEMCRMEGRRLYVRIGFRELDEEESDEEECIGK